MISKKMYKVLKKVPHLPETTNFIEMSKKKLVDISLLKNLLKDAKDKNYIATLEHTVFIDITSSSFGLTELGQTSIEEYKGQKDTEVRANWALVIAGLSFIASVVAIVVSCVQ